MSSGLWLGDYTREAIKRMAQRGSAVVIPLAATEQHGPHLPVYTDTLICEYIARGAVARLQSSAESPPSTSSDQSTTQPLGAQVDPPAVLAPVLSIGCSQHHLAYGGTISFTSATYLQVLRDIGDSLVNDGFRKIIFLNGHGGNEYLMHQTANDLAVHYDIWTASASYWSIARDALLEIGGGGSGLIPGHAGQFETSLIMAIRPELVLTEEMSTEHPARAWIPWAPAGTFIGRHRELTGAGGYTDAPIGASEKQGKKYFTAIIDRVAEWLQSTIHMMKTTDSSHTMESD